MEYLNLYDKEGNLTNEKGIRGARTDKLVGIVIIFIENSNGEFLIQKTSPSRQNIFATTGGHVSYGDNFLNSIVKEVKEELGIEVTKEEVTEVNTYIKDSFIQKVYYLKKDINIEEITIQKDEVQYVTWMSKDNIEKLINNNEFRESNIEGYRYIINNYNN